LRVIGMIWRRFSSVVAFSETARLTGSRAASSAIFGTSPTVDTVILRCE
jgi:hypothetical protein